MKKIFHLLPVITFIKSINPLTPEAKRSFHSSWDYYYTVKIGWLWWEVNI